MCDCKPCGNAAIVECKWASGKTPEQNANLCQEHVNDLWERLNPLVQANIAWFTIGPVK